MHEQRHGEYKVPGGKLVAVDLTVADDHLAQVSVSGDFFLYPEETLALITHALNGQPANASREELTAAVDAAVPPDAELFGFSAEAVAIAEDWQAMLTGMSTPWGAVVSDAAPLPCSASLLICMFFKYPSGSARYINLTTAPPSDAGAKDSSVFLIFKTHPTSSASFNKNSMSFFPPGDVKALGGSSGI